MTTLPLDTFVNEGGHRADLAARTIFNDENWKGWLPKGLTLPLRDIFARLATGYAKRFWKQGNRYLGETIYVDGRIRVKHALEEFTLDRPVNDLDWGSTSCFDIPTGVRALVLRRHEGRQRWSDRLRRIYGTVS